MKKKTIFINWETCFITTNFFDAVDEYLKISGMTLKGYAIAHNIIYNFEELTKQKRTECHKQLLVDMKKGCIGWEVKTL